MRSRRPSNTSRKASSIFNRGTGADSGAADDTFSYKSRSKSAMGHSQIDEDRDQQVGEGSSRALTPTPRKAT